MMEEREEETVEEKQVRRPVRGPIFVVLFRFWEWGNEEEEKRGGGRWLEIEKKKRKTWVMAKGGDEPSNGFMSWGRGRAMTAALFLPWIAGFYGMHCWDDEEEERGGIGSRVALVIILNGH